MKLKVNIAFDAARLKKNGSFKVAELVYMKLKVHEAFTGICRTTFRCGIFQSCGNVAMKLKVYEAFKGNLPYVSMRHKREWLLVIFRHPNPEQFSYKQRWFTSCCFCKARLSAAAMHILLL